MYADYLRDLIDVTRRHWDAVGGQVPREDEDGVAMTERIRGGVCRSVAEELRPTWGSRWRGYDAWAPANADRAVSYVITGF